MSGFDPDSRDRWEIIASREHLLLVIVTWLKRKTTYGHSSELEIAPAVHWELAECVQPIPVDRNALSVVVELEDDLQ